MKRLIVAGDRSGSGKTTVTMALLSALRQRAATVQAFKVGPDYIDPMFHRAITGRPAYNLDPVLTSERYVQQSFQTHSATAAYAIVEGVMGLFDGAGGTDWASTAHIARLLNLPVLLVVDCARLSRSLAAVVHGYQTLDPQIKIAGVVLNRVGSDRHLSMLKGAMAAIQVAVLGVLRRDDAVTLPDRHLGLVPTDELADLPERFQYLAALGQRCFDWQALARVFQAGTSPLTSLQSEGMGAGSILNQAFRHNDGPSPLHSNPSRDVDQAECSSKSPCPVRIGIARDRAFNFYYEDNLELLTHLGVELVPFSPLTADALPSNLSGLLLGGGFPELFAAELSQNVSMRQALAQALVVGLPTIAECGGLMVLCETLVDFEGRSHAMIGTLPATVTMTSKLTLGYRQVTAQRSSPLVIPDQQYWGHEFHRSAIAPESPHPLTTLTTYPLSNSESRFAGEEGWGSESIHASYVHMHWGDRPEFAKRFVEKCDRFQQQSSRMKGRS